MWHSLKIALINYAMIGGTLEAYGSCRVCLSVHLSVCLSFKSRFFTMLEHEVLKLVLQVNTYFSQKKIEQILDLRLCYRLMAWCVHLNSCCQLSRAQRRTNSSQQAAYQHDSSICTTKQTATRVKSRERDCQSYTTQVLPNTTDASTLAQTCVRLCWSLPVFT